MLLSEDTDKMLVIAPNKKRARDILKDELGRSISDDEYLRGIAKMLNYAEEGILSL